MALYLVKHRENLTLTFTFTFLSLFTDLPLDLWSQFITRSLYLRWVARKVLYIPDIKDVNKYMIFILVFVCMWVCARELHAFTLLSSPSLRSLPPPDQSRVVLPVGTRCVAGGTSRRSPIKKKRFSTQAWSWGERERERRKRRGRKY
jgi:hypothetical protein